jgi:hypothetical protein
MGDPLSSTLPPFEFSAPRWVDIDLMRNYRAVIVEARRLVPDEIRLDGGGVFRSAAWGFVVPSAPTMLDGMVEGEIDFSEHLSRFAAREDEKARDRGLYIRNLRFHIAEAHVARFILDVPEDDSPCDESAR